MTWPLDTPPGKTNKWETVKQFRILPRELTVDSGELPQPQGEAARSCKNYADVINDIYS